MTDTIEARVLLLVEDHPGYAALVRTITKEAYRTIHAPRLANAIDTLRSAEVDVIVLDLTLPDCAGVASLEQLRMVAPDTPIVVLTASDDEQFASRCLAAGAQDYLLKHETTEQSLRRAIGYAIARLREAQLRELRELLERYRQLSSNTHWPQVTAMIAGSGAVALRNPDLFDRLVGEYCVLLGPYLRTAVARAPGTRAAMERLITSLGDATGGPRDLVDLHVAAIDRTITRRTDAHSGSLMFEARLLALEMMGLLVDYYRIGQRRRFTEGATI